MLYLGIFIGIIVIYGFIGMYVHYDNKKLFSLNSVFDYKTNINGAYVEYSQWKLLWGFLINSQKEINKLIDEWNNNGYTCIGFQRSYLPNVPIFKIILITIITILTLGFVNYYTGPTLLFVLTASLKGNSDLNNNEQFVNENVSVESKIIKYAATVNKKVDWGTGLYEWREVTLLEIIANTGLGIEIIKNTLSKMNKEGLVIGYAVAQDKIKSYSIKIT